MESHWTLSSAMIWVTYDGDQVVDKLVGLLDRKQRSISDLHWLALLTMLVICGWKDSLESIVTPRSFAVSTVSNCRCYDYRSGVCCWPGGDRL